MGITTAALLAVAPIAMPVINAGTETVVKADATDVDGNVIPADGTYTDNGDGTYTLHGTLNAEVWSGGEHSHPTGTELPFSIEGKKVNSTGDIRITDIPVFPGYKIDVDSRSDYDLMLEDGKVYVFSFLLYEPTDGQTFDTTNPGVPYSATITLSSDATINTNTGLPVVDKSSTSGFAELPASSTWKVDRKMRMYGETYYRVGNNEWIENENVKETAPATNPNVITTKNQAVLYTAKGEKITNRALAANTPWYTDQSATINGQKMYRVATDEWVASSDIQ